MSIKHGLFELTSGAIINGLRLNRANKLLCKFAEKVTPVYSVRRGGQSYLLYCPNELTRWRAETYFTKEPETIEWIDGFSKDDLMIDIGANVGLYSIYAAKAGARVLAFEPESQNYALLNRNLYLNGLADRVQCLNVAISDKDGMGSLFMPKFQPGGALNNLGEARDFRHERFEACYRQAVMSYSLDSFVEKYPQHFPDHIKIDVDGIEGRIIQGAEGTLRDPRLKSLLIELNEALPEDLECCQQIQALGLRLIHKKRSEITGQAEFATMFNYIFAR